MKDFQLTTHNVDQLFSLLHDELLKTPMLTVSVQSAAIGKWTMTRLWRSWMTTTAKFMADNGVTMPLMVNGDGGHYGKRPFNADDAHELFCSQWLGVDADGTRLSWSRSGHDGMRAATKGERFNALRKHEAWAVERGIKLFRPKDSEYEKLSDVE